LCPDIFGNSHSGGQFAITPNAFVPLLDAAKMAVSRSLVCDDGGRPGLFLQGPIGPFHGLFMATCDQVGQGKSAIKCKTLRIKRAQPDRSPERFDRRTRSVKTSLSPSTKIPREGAIGIEGKCALDSVQARSPLSGQVHDAPAAHPERVGIFLALLDRQPLEARAFGNFFIRDHPVRSLDDAAPSEQTCGRRVRRIERKRPVQQADRITPALHRALPELYKRS
jgi:hypothetical protein